MAQAEGWSRRGLLSARGLGVSTGGLIATLIPAKSHFIAGDDGKTIGHWVITRRAMACDFSVHLPPLTAEPLVAAKAALDEIEAMEDLLTVYHEDSGMSYVNQNAFDRPVRTDARLFELLQQSAVLTAETGGTFDIATGRLIKAWGFFQGPRRVPSDEELAAALAASGMRHVELDADELTVRYRAAGLEINLGSIGKGYAIDRAARRMREEFGITCGLVSGGSSSMLALGSLTGEEGGWLVGIQHPMEPDRRIVAVRLRDRALGTSSTVNQYFEEAGRRYGHLIDPRTGQPADEVASASALTPDSATADALATAFFVGGLDKTAEFCQNHRDIAALLVLKDHRPGRSNQPRVVTFNLPPEDVNLRPGDDPPAPDSSQLEGVVSSIHG